MDSPVSFTIEKDEIERGCCLTFKKTGGLRENPDGDYILTIKDVLATKLPLAPPIKKENLAPVCRSEVLEYIGEIITRVDWLLFVRGLRTTFSAEHNKRTQTCTISVAGKMVSQFSCEDPSETSELPYLITREG